MAVRNLQGIYRESKKITAEKANAKSIKLSAFWGQINVVKSSHDNAIDAIDTINELRRNGLWGEYKKWEKTQDFYYDLEKRLFRLGCLSSYIEYKPIENEIGFFYSSPGGMEYHSTEDKNIEYFITYYFPMRENMFGEKLDMLCSKLQPFLDSLFEWVDSF